MLRRIFNLQPLIAIPENFQNYQTLRWARKPRKPIWKGTAKSKLFRIPVRHTYPPEETEEVKRLFHHYQTIRKSIQKFLTERYSVQLQEEADTEQLRKTFEEDFVRCSTINEQWNEQRRVERDERVARTLQEDIEFAKSRMAQILQDKEKKQEEVEEIVRREKRAVENFITPEMLDEVIERAINNPVDYNFAIDLEGNRIIGRETIPGDVVKAKQ